MTVRIHNLPDAENMLDRYIVATADEHSREFWFYAQFEDEKTAKKCANERNAYVFENELARGYCES